MKSKINKEMREIVIDYYKKGKYYQEIAEYLGVSKMTIYRFLRNNNLINTDRETQHICKSDENEIGKKYSNLTIIEFCYIENIQTWGAKCICDCGRETIDTIRKLKNGEKKTCGNKNCKHHIDLAIANGSLGHNSTGYGDILGSAWLSWVIGAKKRKLDFNITIQYAWELFEKQNRKCALTGEDIKFRKGINREQTASLDRIDSSKPYIEGNVQWVHKHINIMKGALTEEKFIDYCNKIVIWSKN